MKHRNLDVKGETERIERASFSSSDDEDDTIDGLTDGSSARSRSRWTRLCAMSCCCGLPDETEFEDALPNSRLRLFEEERAGPLPVI